MKIVGVSLVALIALLGVVGVLGIGGPSSGEWANENADVVKDRRDAIVFSAYEIIEAKTDAEFIDACGSLNVRANQSVALWKQAPVDDFSTQYSAALEKLQAGSVACLQGNRPGAASLIREAIAIWNEMGYGF